jgi:hypothetical protein
MRPLYCRQELRMSMSVGVWEEVAPIEERLLADEHRRTLEIDSRIDPDIIEERGYYSLTQRQIIDLVHREIIVPAALRADSWMSIPMWRPDGTKHGEIIRLFGGDTRFKYVWPTGLRLCVDVHPGYRVYLQDTSIPIFITEGIKKADAIVSAAEREGREIVVLAVNGCDGWKTKIEGGGGSIASPDFLDIAWEDRHVYVNSDSDYRTNNRVSFGWNGCATYLSSKTGEHRTFVVVTPPRGTEKQGADDFLAGGKGLGDLLEHAQSPERAVLDQSGGYAPLKLRSGRQLIRDAGEKIPHMIAPLIPERSITLVAGHSGTFKTWHMLGLATDGAFGLPWLAHPGLTPEYGRFTTLYVNKEMSGLILGQRLKTLARNERYTSITDFDEALEKRLVFSEEAELDLNNEEQRDRLEDAIGNAGVQMVVLDSLSMCWHGDENSASEVGDLYTKLRGIIERTGCCFVPIHHLLKPQGGKVRKNQPVSQFSIRGSGQLYQQADACIMLELYASPIQADDEKLVAIHHVKARTSVEMPAWVTTFSSNDGLFQSMTYLCKLSEIKAREYAESGGDANKLQAWIVEACMSMPAMLPGPGNPGFRSKQLFLMLQQAWNIPDKPPPSEATLYRQMQALVGAGKLVVLDDNRRHGNLYQLAQPTDPDEEAPVETELAPPTAPVVR